MELSIYIYKPHAIADNLKDHMLFWTGKISRDNVNTLRVAILRHIDAFKALLELTQKEGDAIEGGIVEIVFKEDTGYINAFTVDFKRDEFNIDDLPF